MYGDLFVAAAGIATRIYQVPRLLVLGLAQGTQPFLGYNFSAGNIKRLKMAFWFSACTGVIFGCVCLTAAALFAPDMIRFFMRDSEIVMEGATFLKIYCASMPVLTCMFLLWLSLQAFGKNKYAMITAVLRDGVFFIGAILIFNAAIGVNGVIWAQPVADTLTVFAAAILFKLAIQTPNEKIQRRGVSRMDRT